VVQAVAFAVTWPNPPLTALIHIEITALLIVVNAGGFQIRFQILNLGMRFSNECGGRLNLRRMDRFIFMIMLKVKTQVARI
jgi:hypothetical protein